MSNEEYSQSCSRMHFMLPNKDENRKSTPPSHKVLQGNRHRRTVLFNLKNN